MSNKLTCAVEDRFIGPYGHTRIELDKQYTKHWSLIKCRKTQIDVS